METQTETKLEAKLYTPGLDTFRKFADLIKWCTPSVFPEVIEGYNLFGEGSISIASIGKLQDNTGIFEVIHGLAAEAYGNFGGHSHYGCEGTSGANRILFDLISKIFTGDNSDKHVLSSRNVHKSIVTNAETNKVPINYIRAGLDEKSGIFLPPSVDDVINEIDENTGLVLLSNPTYEGYSSDIGEIVKKVNELDSSILIYVDEAWGAHLNFSPKLPMSAVEAGADFVVHSMHKQGGAPNPSNITHLSKRVKEAYLDDFLKSYQERTSTTYSYPLIAAMDLARAIMASEGDERIDNLIELANKFRYGVGNIRGIMPISISEVYDQIHSYDPTKINLDVSGTGISGDHIASELENRYGIITEKEELACLSLITTFGITSSDVEKTLDSLESVTSYQVNRTLENNLKIEFPQKLEKRYATWEAELMDKYIIRLEDAIGHTLGENISLYPPGIFLAQKGEVVDEPLVGFLSSQRSRSHVYANDSTLNTLLVVEQ